MKKVLLLVAVFVTMASCQKDYYLDELNLTKRYLDSASELLQKLSLEKEALILELQEALAEINSLEIGNMFLNGLVDSLTNLNRDLRDALNESESLNTRLQLDLANSEAQNEVLTAEAIESELLLQEALSLSASLTLDLEDAYKIIQDLNDSMDSQNDYIFSLEMNVSTLEGLNADQEHRLNKLLVRIQSKNQTIANLRNRVAKLRAIINARG